MRGRRSRLFHLHLETANPARNQIVKSRADDTEMNAITPSMIGKKISHSKHDTAMSAAGAVFYRSIAACCSGLPRKRA